MISRLNSRRCAAGVKTEKQVNRTENSAVIESHIDDR